MEAYLKRESEQSDFLNELKDSVKHDAEGEMRLDEEFLYLTIELITLVLNGMGSAVEPMWRSNIGEIARDVIKRVDEFARTPEEGMHLKHSLIESILGDGFSRAEGEYLHQRVHQAPLLYEGHQAMDEVD